MATPAIMLQGAGSDVGKSLIVAGLCRAFADRGLAVRPFKPQNMSNNAAVTADGGEIGRAQALQARASRVAPTVDMNPVLLKPESERGAQLVVRGRVAGRTDAREYQRRKSGLMPAVLESFARVSDGADLVLVEGAGSPSEINLRAGDIANMGFAEAAGVPVALIGDIDRGGVIASLVGAHALFSDGERARVRGFLVNKFRGDPSLFDDGLAAIAERTGWPPLGLVPWFADARRLPAEDAVALDSRLYGSGGGGRIKVTVPRFACIANFDDLDPLAAEPSVALDMVEPGRALPGDADLVVLPGSKTTLADLALLRREGWDIDIAAHLRRGGRLLGLCAGYQMLGSTVADPDGVEGPPGEAAGLGYLEVETRLTGRKALREAAGRHLASGEAVRGYEMHMGVSEGPGLARPFLELDGRPHGAVSADGRVAGGYLHGLFSADGFRRAFLGSTGNLAYDDGVDAVLDALAGHLAAAVDLERMLEIADARH